MMQLRNESIAEDVVSETFLAILEPKLRGRSSLRTYATGILSFKIIGVIRKRGREVHIEPLDEQSMDDAMGRALRQKDGHWQDPPPVWQHPESRSNSVSSSRSCGPASTGCLPRSAEFS